MKKILPLLFLFALFNQGAYAYYCSPHCPYNHTHYYNRAGYHYSYSHSSRYLVNKEYFEDTHAFPNCKEHSLLSQTTVYYYSDGSRRSYINYTILNSDGTILESDCREVKHILLNKKHYFVIRKNNVYKIINSKGEIITKRNYSSIKETLPNKFLVKADKKYGLINIEDKEIIPIKYKSLELFGGNLFISKLNGYYGIIDINGNILAKNQYDSIKTLYDTFLLKKEGKYGLYSLDGNVILEANYDKIKKLGEYILIKKDREYQILNSKGTFLTNEKFKKVRLKRNSLEVKYDNSAWEKLNEDL